MLGTERAEAAEDPPPRVELGRGQHRLDQHGSVACRRRWRLVPQTRADEMSMDMEPTLPQMNNGDDVRSLAVLSTIGLDGPRRLRQDERGPRAGIDSTATATVARLETSGTPELTASGQAESTKIVAMTPQFGSCQREEAGDLHPRKDPENETVCVDDASRRGCLWSTKATMRGMTAPPNAAEHRRPSAAGGDHPQVRPSSWRAGEARCPPQRRLNEVPWASATGRSRRRSKGCPPDCS